MWYVYILRSINFPDEKYMGTSEDLKRRMSDHNAGKSTHTSKFSPWELLWYCAFSLASKEQLIDWLVGNTTGDTRLRAAMPSSWKVGDKTGTGENGASNDVAIIWPDKGKPFLIVVYYTGSSVSVEARNAVIAEAGRIVRTLFFAK